MPQERHEASECSEACPYSFVANLRARTRAVGHWKHYARSWGATLRRHAALRRGVSAKPLPKGAGVWHSEIPIGLMYLLEPRYAFPPSHNRMSIPYDYGYSLSSSVKPTSCHPTSQSLDVQVYSCRLLLLVGSAV